MTQRIYTDHKLLPDTDGTVVAAGPIVGGDGIVDRRTVLRHQADGNYVVHDQQYPNLNRGGLIPYAEYHNGDYVGSDDKSAFASFVKRLIRTGNTALNVPTDDMLPNLIALPDDFAECERGNDLFQDDDGNFAAWIGLGENLKLEITFNRANYPALNVALVKLSDEKLAAHINEKLGGWVASKCNIEGVNLEEKYGELYVVEQDEAVTE